MEEEEKKSARGSLQREIGIRESEMHGQRAAWRKKTCRASTLQQSQSPLPRIKIGERKSPAKTTQRTSGSRDKLKLSFHKTENPSEDPTPHPRANPLSRPQSSQLTLISPPRHLAPPLLVLSKPKSPLSAHLSIGLKTQSYLCIFFVVIVHARSL